MLEKIKDSLQREKVDILKYQTGQKVPVNLGREYLVEPFGGMLPGDILAIAGHSSAGKTYELAKIKSNIMNVDLNPDAMSYVWAEYSLEMKLFSVMLRDLSSSLSLSKKEIISREFSAAEKAAARNVFAKYDDRFYISQTPLTVKEWYEEQKIFLELHSDKKGVFVSIDHLSLLRSSDKGKTTMIGDLLTYANELKLTYKNVYFIFLSQMAPSFFANIAERSRQSFPSLTNLFYSSEIGHYCDYVLVVVNAEYLGIHEYGSVSVDRYPYLEKYFTEPDRKGKVAFYTDGLIFHHLIKAREAEPGYKDIFVTEIRPRQERVHPTVQQDLYQTKAAEEFMANLTGAKVTPNKNKSDLFDELPFKPVKK